MPKLTCTRLPLLLLAMARLAVSIEFPNNVIGTPVIDCLVDSIKLSIDTSQGNPSHLFVKGRHHEAPCVVRNSNMITIGHDQCGLQRERNLNPAGVFYRVCVVVQLHPQFITKVDKTFCASCFYMEAVKEVTQELGVSVLSSTEVAISFPMPQCSYTIRRGSPTGPEIRFATVGEPVYHVWSCPSDAYGMLVQNCYVDDGQGNRILIVDQNGCGVDRYIIQTPNYNEDLTMAFQESHVFKFADKTITRFTCQIKVCIKAGGSCEGITPPLNCPAIGGRPGPSGGLNSFGGKPRGGFNSVHGSANRNQRYPIRFRGIRSVQDLWDQPGEYDPTNNFESDVNTELWKKANLSLPRPEDLVDAEDPDYIGTVTGELFVLEDIGQIPKFGLHANDEFEKSRSLRPENAICVPTSGFVVMLILFCLLIIIGLVSTTFLLLKSRDTFRKKLPSKSSSKQSLNSSNSSFSSRK